jgi:mono/diheme cytochrome c family protein
MRFTTRLASGMVLLILAVPPCAADDSKPAPSAQDVEFFETKVRPVFAQHCFSCHGPKRQEAGLRLDQRDGFQKGSDNGPIVIPGKADESPLLKAIRYNDELKMPPKGKLPAEALAALTAWVKNGASWPAASAASGSNALDQAKAHWALQPIRSPSLPPVKHPEWTTSPIDYFVLARQEVAGLTPGSPADRRTLIRRVTFDLIGLPPTAEEVEAFVNDQTSEAFARVVDRLLASPQYGERWARYWLDVARYADTKGYVFTEERRYPFAYTYRDYVIRAFNEDLPYDRFIMEQLAADQLPLGDDKRPLAAMGFLTLGRRFLNNPHDIIDDRLDVTMRGLQGLTIGCARCHDHKFDPIPMKDYYSLYGVFASSVEPKDAPTLGQVEQTPAFLEFERELKAREADVKRFQVSQAINRVAALHLPATPIQFPASELARFYRRADRDKLRALERRVDQWRASSPAAPPRPMMLRDLPRPVEPHVFLRGNPNSQGEAVPRQYLLAVAGPSRKPFKQGSGRLELAQAIASKDNPLTARVLVNRVWLHHFGVGLVHTPSDFGLRCDPPTHPELLDYLARRFMEDGWSLKKLHRLIVLSSTYQQASGDNPGNRRLDPDNNFLWRMNRQRLDFEALRDSILAVTGSLDTKSFGPAVDLAAQPFIPRRTLYGFVDRQNLPGMFRVFDFASPDTSSPQRFQTTVPQQALYLLNSPFIAEQARRLLARADVAELPSPSERIRKLHRLLYGRDAGPEEVVLGEQFVASMQTASPPTGLSAWEKYGQVLLLANEFVFVD